MLPLITSRIDPRVVSRVTDQPSPLSYQLKDVFVFENIWINFHSVYLKWSNYIPVDLRRHFFFAISVSFMGFLWYCHAHIFPYQG